MPEDQFTQPTRYRIAYKKLDPVRFTGHLDVQRIWERILRRGKIPVAFTQGYNPRPRINMSSALPLGFTSSCELLDIWINEEIPSNTLLETLRQVSIPGIEIDHVSIPPISEPKLQQMIQASIYRVRFLTPIYSEKLDSQCDDLVSAEECFRSRRGKRYDLRPLIHELCVLEGTSGEPILQMTLSSIEGATGRPEEVLHALGYEPAEARIHREAFVLRRREVED